MKRATTETSQETAAPEPEEAPSKRRAVVPGETIVTGEDYLPGDGVRRDGEHVVATRFGMAEVIGHVVKVISVSGAYVPRRNNTVLGRVRDISFNGWMIDIDSAGSAFLPIAESPRFINQNEMDQFLAIGDVIAAKIWSIKGRGIDLMMDGKGLGKLEGGYMFRISATRIPRVIGREGSMIMIIKEHTSCSVTAGQNGWVWVNGPSVESVFRARRAIEYIADNVHISGLTEHMEEWFQKN
ncbi:MAG TPA: KH domain-containing protein [Candidatus Nanoarchaeia archaeon]|nr:KH domain-containing protein [Candidatus Nanoarchaeia archaeon]